MPSRALLPLGVIAFCGFLAEGTVNDWSAVYLTNQTAASGAVASLGYFGFSITMILVRLAADQLAASVGAARLMRCAAVVAALGFLIVAGLPTPGLGVLGFSVVGLGVSAIVPLAWSAAAKVSPDSSGQAISAVAACGYLGFLTGPAVLGVIAGTLGLRLAMLCVLAFVAVVYLLAGSVRAQVLAKAASRS